MTIDPKKKSRLGRGLTSLMGMNHLPTHAETPADPLPSPVAEGRATDAEIAPRGTPLVPATPAASTGTPALLEINLVDPNPRQPRRTFTDAALAELASSIKANGLIQPITVKAIGTRYELIAGERRLRASKLAGLPTIPAFVREASELEQAQMALVENIQREDLNPIDRAAGYRTLVSELGLSQAELAGRLGEDRSTITNHLRLLELPDDVVEMVRQGDLSLGHAKVLCGIADSTEQTRLAKLVLSQSLSVRNLERILATPATDTPAASAKSRPSAHLKDLEVNMSKQLGMRVQVKAAATKGKGKVVIHYNSLDEFDNLLGKIGVALEE